MYCLIKRQKWKIERKQKYRKVSCERAREKAVQNSNEMKQTNTMPTTINNTTNIMNYEKLSLKCKWFKNVKVNFHIIIRSVSPFYSLTGLPPNESPNVKCLHLSLCVRASIACLICMNELNETIIEFIFLMNTHSVRWILQNPFLHLQKIAKTKTKTKGKIKPYQRVFECVLHCSVVNVVNVVKTNN